MKAPTEDRLPSKTFSFPYFYYDAVARLIPGGITIIAVSLWVGLGVWDTPVTRTLASAIRSAMAQYTFLFSGLLIGLAYLIGAVFDGLYRGLRRHVFVKAWMKHLTKWKHGQHSSLNYDQARDLLLQAQALMLSLEAEAPHLTQQAIRISAESKMVVFSTVPALAAFSALGIAEWNATLNPLAVGAWAGLALVVIVILFLATRYFMALYVEQITNTVNFVENVGSPSYKNWAHQISSGTSTSPQISMEDSSLPALISEFFEQVKKQPPVEGSSDMVVPRVEQALTEAWYNVIKKKGLETDVSPGKQASSPSASADAPPSPRGTPASSRE